MRYLIYIMVIGAMLYGEGRLSFAAMDDESSPDQVIEWVVRKRQEAKQEYEAYMQNKKAEEITSTPVRTQVARLEDAAYAGAKKDMLVGVLFLLCAVILGIWVYLLSRQKQKA